MPLGLGALFELSQQEKSKLEMPVQRRNIIKDTPDFGCVRQVPKQL